MQRASSCFTVSIVLPGMALSAPSVSSEVQLHLMHTATCPLLYAMAWGGGWLAWVEWDWSTSQ